MASSTGKRKLRLKPWLEMHLNSGLLPGLKWIDKDKSIFKIPWYKFDKSDWPKEMAELFKLWMIHTGKKGDHQDIELYSLGKKNLRCAMNSAKNIVKVKNEDYKQPDPHRVYRFVKEKKEVKLDDTEETQVPGKPPVPSFLNDKSSESSGSSKNLSQFNTQQLAELPDMTTQATQLQLTEDKLLKRPNIEYISNDSQHTLLQPLIDQNQQLPYSQVVPGLLENSPNSDTIFSSPRESIFSPNSEITQSPLSQSQGQSSSQPMSTGSSNHSSNFSNMDTTGVGNMLSDLDALPNDQLLLLSVAEPKDSNVAASVFHDRQFSSDTLTNHRCDADDGSEMYIEIIYLGNMVADYHITSSNGCHLFYGRERNLPDDFKDDYYGKDNSKRKQIQFPEWPSNLGHEQTAVSVLQNLKRGVILKCDNVNSGYISILRKCVTTVYICNTSQKIERNDTPTEILNFKQLLNPVNGDQSGANVTNQRNSPPCVIIYFGTSPVGKNGQHLQPSEVCVSARITSCKALKIVRGDEHSRQGGEHPDLSCPNLEDDLASVMENCLNLSNSVY